MTQASLDVRSSLASQIPPGFRRNPGWWSSGRYGVLVVCLLLQCSDRLCAADWPTWRYDAARTANSPEKLPDVLHLQWVRQLPPTRPAWPASQTKLQFDASYEPIVLGDKVFVASMVTDSVTAYDTRTGEEEWRFHADGPIRFAPVGHRDKVLAASDDGYLYCLRARDGKQVWRFRGGSSESRVLGNDRLVSAWPVRGAPVVFDDTVYFGAGIWPFMGVFLHALDVDSGTVVWTNSGAGSIYILQPHDSPAFAGVSPQGYLAATDTALLVAGGRTVPAAFDRETGAFRYFQAEDKEFGAAGGGYRVMTVGNAFFNGLAAYDLTTGNGLRKLGATVLTDTVVFAVEEGELRACATPPAVGTEPDPTSIPADQADSAPSPLSQLWACPLAPKWQRIMMKASDRLYVAGANNVGSLALLEGKATGDVLWETELQGQPSSMLAGDGRLFVMTREGALHCFGGSPPPKIEKHDMDAKAAPVPDRSPAGLAARTGVNEGYCIVFGLGNGKHLAELVENSSLHCIGIDSSAKRVDDMRRLMCRDGYYGVRTSVHVGDVRTFDLPAYCASLIVALERGALPGDTREWAKRVFGALRPFGGVACLDLSPRQRQDLADLIASGDLPGGVLRESDGLTLLERAGPLPGSANWTHQYSDAANTVFSPDRLVRSPLGLLWFGGPPNDPILPRHGHGPSPHVVDGRLFIEGVDLLRAVDVYTGRLLWEKPLPGLGTFYDITSHQPGANEIGSNVVSVSGAIYVMLLDRCLRLAPATGETIDEIALPGRGEAGNARWGSIRVVDDLLIATSSPIGVPNFETGDVPPWGMELLIPREAEWQYLASKTSPPSNWASPEFDSSAWPVGRAGFGFDKKKENTVLDNMRRNHSVVFARKEFAIPDPGTVDKLTLLVRFEDAFVAYLNGTEIRRAGVPRGRPGEKLAKISRHRASRYEDFPIEVLPKLLRAGTNLLAIEGHNRSVSDSKFTLDPYLAVRWRAPGSGAGSQDQIGPTVVPKGTDWQYLAGSHPSDPDWKKLEFKATGWKTGAAGFGYGDDDDMTVLTDMAGHYTTVYIRRAFEMETPTEKSGLELRIRFDDAFIAYLNGTEVLRVRVGSGAGSEATGIGSHEAGEFEAFRIPNAAELLRPGLNLLAIEGHNAGIGSSDFSLDPYVVTRTGEDDGEDEPDPRDVAFSAVPGVVPRTTYASASKTLVVMNRHTGDVLWSRDARNGFRHNTIAIGGGRVFCIDGISRAKVGYLSRRGHLVTGSNILYAFDLATGEEAWAHEEDIFGTWLGYSGEHDILLEAGSRAGDRAVDEVSSGMAAFRGGDGTLVWRSRVKYAGPCIIHHDRIITQTGGSNVSAPPAFAYSLLTGEQIMTTHPLTGEQIPWAWVRFKGCNTAIASEHLLTFRSASGCFAETQSGHGTVSIGGFKSGCTSNLIAANGVLSAPDYTRTCTCPYQNQSSLALIHMPDGDDVPGPGIEEWSFDYLPMPAEPTAVKRVGINFGAPGNRLAVGGTLWLESPSVGGPSPDIPVRVEPTDARLLRYHMSRLSRQAAGGDSQAPRWVGASGLEGATMIRIRPFLQPTDPAANRTVRAFDRHARTNKLASVDETPTGSFEPPRRYTLQLHFAEIRDLGPGDCVFDVLVQGEKVLEHFDIVREAGAANVGVVREVQGVEVTDDITLELRPVPGASKQLPLICGIELAAEDAVGP